MEERLIWSQSIERMDMISNRNGPYGLRFMGHSQMKKGMMIRASFDYVNMNGPGNDTHFGGKVKKTSLIIYDMKEKLKEKNIISKTTPIIYLYN